MKWEVTDQNGKDLFCIEVPVAVQSKKQENTLYYESGRTGQDTKGSKHENRIHVL